MSEWDWSSDVCSSDLMVSLEALDGCPITASGLLLGCISSMGSLFLTFNECDPSIIRSIFNTLSENIMKLCRQKQLNDPNIIDYCENLINTILVNIHISIGTNIRRSL